METSQEPDTRYTDTWTGGRGEVRFQRLPGGARVRYLKAGTGPALVLLHTARTQLDYFQLVVPRIWDSYTVYALDLPGMGWSDIVPGAGYREPELRGAVVEFLEALDLRDVTLAGESMGATLALSAAPELGQRVSCVLAFNTYDFPEGIERGNSFAKLIIGCARLPVLGKVFTTLENRPILKGVLWGGFSDRRRLPEHFAAELRRVGRRRGYPRVAHEVFRNLESLIAARGRYQLVQVPVVLVYSDGDWSRPADREGVERLLPHARSLRLADTGHFSALERPDEVAQIMLDARERVV